MPLRVSLPLEILSQGMRSRVAFPSKVALNEARRYGRPAVVDLFTGLSTGEDGNHAASILVLLGPLASSRGYLPIGTTGLPTALLPTFQPKPENDSDT